MADAKTSFQPLGKCMAFDKLEFALIDRPVASTEIMNKAEAGVQKHFVLMFRPFSENKLYYYDQDSNMICDIAQLVDDKTTKVICTNQVRQFGIGLEGSILFEGPARVMANKRQTTHLSLIFDDMEQLFDDQFSLLTFIPPSKPGVEIEATLM